MAELEQLYDALRKADAAGNTEDAKNLANYIRSQSLTPDTLGRYVAKSEEPQKAPEEVGFFEAIPAAFKRGVESLSDVTAGLGLAKTAALGTEAETKAKMESIKAEQERQQREETKPGMTVADFERLYKEKGFVEAAKEAPKYIVEQFLQSAPQMAGPLAAGAAATPFLSPVGGALVGMGVYGVQQFGNFLVRQAQEKDDPQQLEIAKAAIAAGATAPIGYFADRFTLGLGGIGEKSGVEAIKELAKRRALGEVGAGAVTKEVAKRAGAGAVEGIIAEAPTEVLEQVAERYQAGLPLTGDEAMQEYKEAFFGAAAAGGGLGGAARGIGTYGGYRSQLRALEAPVSEHLGPNAFEETKNYEQDIGAVGRGDEPSVSVPTPEDETERGVEGAIPAGVAGTIPPAEDVRAREAGVHNTLRELRTKLKDTENYIRDIADFNPQDDRLEGAMQYANQLREQIRDTGQQLEVPPVRAEGAKPPPTQMGFEFPEEEPGKEPERRIPSEPTEFGLMVSEGRVAPAQEVEEIIEPDRARMGIIGEEKDPAKPITNFFESIKPDTVNPEEAERYKAKVKNLIEEAVNFIGGKGPAEVARYREEGEPAPVPPTGPDVTVRLKGPELQKRTAVLDNFFDSLSAAPKEKETQTSALASQLPSMSTEQQTAAFQELLNVPNINTIRGIDKVRAKLQEAIARYERRRTGQEEPALPFKAGETIRSTNPLLQRRINSVISALEGVDQRFMTPDQKAAMIYLKAHPYITAMRSAAFDLAIPLDEKNHAGIAVYKDQTHKNAELFQKWVEENLPQQEYKRFQATVAEYKNSVNRANQAIKNMQARKESGVVAPLYERMIGRAPTGKVPGISARYDLTPPDVKNLDPADFYPMHPSVLDRLERGDVKGALAVIARDPGAGASNKVKFTAKYAQRLLDLNLPTTVSIGKELELAHKFIKEETSKRKQVLQWFNSSEATKEFVKHFKLDTHPATAQEIRNQYHILSNILNGQVNLFPESEIKPIIGQLKDVVKAYENATVTVDSPGTYIDAWNTLNLSREQHGLSNGIFLHEMTHAATVWSLYDENYEALDAEQKKAVDELKKLYDFSKNIHEKNLARGLADEKYVEMKGRRYLYDEVEYGFRNVREFVAEAYSNWDFQEYLKSMRYQGTPVSLWDKFVKTIIKFFKLDNVLGFTLANANALMRPTPLFEGNSAGVNVEPAKRRLAVANTLPSNPGYVSFINRVFGGKQNWEAAKYNVADMIDNVQDTTRKYYLGAFTLRQISDMIGHKIPRIRTFIERIEEMIDDRNQMLAEGERIGKRFVEFRSKDYAKYDMLSRLMIDVTLDARDAKKVNKDPALGKTGIKEIDDTWNAIGPEGQAIYKQVRDYYVKYRQEFINITLNDVKQSLLNQGYDQKDIDAHDLINQKYADKDEEYLRRLGFTQEKIDVHFRLKGIEDWFNKHTIDVYFPLYRTGEYSLQLGRDKNREYYLFKTAGQRNAYRNIRLQELADKGVYLDPKDVIAENSRVDLKTNNLQDFQFFEELKGMINSGTSATAAELKNELMDSLEQMQFLLLPDQNLRKRFIHRKGVSGMSVDMADAFAHSAFHMAYQLSRKKNSREIYRLIDGAEQNVKEKGGRERTIESDYLNEVKKRVTSIMNPIDTGGLPNLLSNFSFLWYLTSPASALVNMLGVPAVSIPVMGARFGNVNSTTAVFNYTKLFAKSGFKGPDGKTTFPSINNNLGLLNDLQQRAFKKLGADGLFDITLPHTLVGLAEKPSTMASGVMDTALKYGTALFHGAEKFNREIVGMATFDLAYKQFKDKGYTDENAFNAAVNTAKDLTYKSMGDYATLNKPRWFQHPTLKVILQFKLFAQNMTYLLGRSAYEIAYRNYTPDERSDIANIIRGVRVSNNQAPLSPADLNKAVDAYIKDIRTEAIKRMASTLGMTAVFAGATGLPLWSFVSMVINAMHAVFGDDDDEWDFDNWFKNWCNDTFGGFVGDSISRGVVSQTLGVDAQSRLSLNDMWYRDMRKSNDSVSAVQNMMIALLGPTASTAINFAQAYDDYNKGYTDRAVENAMPALFKNVLKGIRMENEGRATTLKGNELVGDITGKEAFMQGVGFTPERLAQRQQANIQMKTMEQKILNRRQSLLDAYFLAIDNNDSEMLDKVIEKVVKFNQAYPMVGIKADQIAKSVKTRYQQRAMAEVMGGMSINKKLMGTLAEKGRYGLVEPAE